MIMTIELRWLTAVMLVSIRLGVVFLLTPVFSLVGLPVNVRVLLVLALAAMLVSGMAGNLYAAVPTAPGALAVAALNELALGSLLAFALLAGFAAFQLGGRILDIQLGFGVAQLIDPTTRAQAPLLGTILNMAAVLLFFAIGGHRLLLKGLAFSLYAVPPGSSLSGIPVRLLIEQFGAMFVNATLVAGPVVIVVLMVDVALAIMSRTLPQLNIFIIGLPLKILVGLVVLAIAMGSFTPLFSRIFAGLFENWQAVLSSY